jgi:hypothetical protein
MEERDHFGGPLTARIRRYPLTDALTNIGENEISDSIHLLEERTPGTQLVVDVTMVDELGEYSLEPGPSLDQLKLRLHEAPVFKEHVVLGIIGSSSGKCNWGGCDGTLYPYEERPAPDTIQYCWTCDKLPSEHSRCSEPVRISSGGL